MPAASASCGVVGACVMPGHSHIANYLASGIIRNPHDDVACWISHTASMADADDKNGGPNNLRAWRIYRRMKGADLARALDITPGMVSDLENSNRALSAKWLRRIAPVLGTTPGMLLDHDPHELPEDMVNMWGNADANQRRQLIDIAKAIVRTGTDG